MPPSPDQILRRYPYQRLQNDKSLRLLKLLHGSESTQDIHCELFEVLPKDVASYKYDALSWTWTSRDSAVAILITHKDKAYTFNVEPNLASALRALRLVTKSRILWVDAICINQDDPDEKNHQIPMMSTIYGEAELVCIWLGEANHDSKRAIDFIEDNVLNLWEFDKLCENKAMVPQWNSLLSLIMRPWFSRRWVVQEISLANKGMIYCGRQKIPWRKFADAVSLFVEVETATHRLSEVMKQDTINNHIPDFFENVDTLSATLLIEATDNLFRRTQDGEKERLSSLEYLVSSLAVFKASDPRDTIYALLAIAKDTSPIAFDSKSAIPAWQTWTALGRRWRSKPYNVDYQQPFFEICKSFVEFSILQSEPTRALDILCRPWAPKIERSEWNEANKVDNPNRFNITWLEKLPTWIQSASGAAFQVNEYPHGEKMDRINADALVGLPTLGQRNYSAAGDKQLDPMSLRFLKGRRYYSLNADGFVLDKVGELQEIARGGHIPLTWLEAGGWEEYKTKDPPEEFWRTVVANRGPGGRNPKTFYPTACKASVRKGMHGDYLDTNWLISHGQCSIVAQFLRRVQAVIWNKRMIRTSRGSLGLVHNGAQKGDLICILYGCTVPVILRPVPLTPDEVKREAEEEKHVMERDAALKIFRCYKANKIRKLEREKKRAKAAKEAEEAGSAEEPAAQSEDQNAASNTKNPNDDETSEKYYSDEDVTASSVEEPKDNLENGDIANHQEDNAETWTNNVQEHPKPPATGFGAYFWHIVGEYKSLATWLLPLFAGLYIKFKRQVFLDVLLVCAAVIVIAVSAMLPKDLGRRTFAKFDEARSGFLSIIGLQSKAFCNLDRSISKDPTGAPDEKTDMPNGKIVTPGEMAQVPTASADKAKAGPNQPAKKIKQCYYQVIGECYIHGMMDGEAIKWQNENLNSIKAKTFELR